MTQNDIDTTNLENINNGKRIFSAKVARLNALACSFPHRDDTDIVEAEKDSQNGLKVLGVNGRFQEMLAA